MHVEFRWGMSVRVGAQSVDGRGSRGKGEVWGRVECEGEGQGGVRVGVRANLLISGQPGFVSPFIPIR